MANFTLEDTTGHVECVCFDYEKNQGAIQEDAIVTCKGKYEVNDRGSQLLIYEAKPLELTDDQMSMAPLQLELTIVPKEVDSLKMDKLMGILKKHPGRDPIVIYVEQSDGNRLRAELPFGIDSTNAHLKAHLHELFGRTVWRAS